METGWKLNLHGIIFNDHSADRDFFISNQFLASSQQAITRMGLLSNKLLGLVISAY